MRPYDLSLPGTTFRQGPRKKRNPVNEAPEQVRTRPAARLHLEKTSEL